MATEQDLATVQRLLVSESSIPAQLRMGEGLDERAYVELMGALERLAEHFGSRNEVPKALAFAFVDVSSGFNVEPDAYPASERERIEDAGQELSRIGQALFGDDD